MFAHIISGYLSAKGRVQDRRYTFIHTTNQVGLVDR